MLASRQRKVGRQKYPIGGHRMTKSLRNQAVGGNYAVRTAVGLSKSRNLEPVLRRVQRIDIGIAAAKLRVGFGWRDSLDPGHRGFLLLNQSRASHFATIECGIFICNCSESHR